jgi:hypothetical protein
LSTVPPTPQALPTHPDTLTLPLTDPVLAAYRALYKSLQTAIQSTTDLALLQPLNDAREDVDNVLTKDTLYLLHEDAALFDALTDQIDDTNKNLATLTQQIAAIASHIAIAGDVVAAIGKLLTMVPLPGP